MIRHILLSVLVTLLCSFPSLAIDHPGITEPVKASGRFTLIDQGVPVAVVVDPADAKGVLLAADNLREDFARVCGQRAPETGSRAILAGTVDSPLIKRLVAEGLLDVSAIKGQYESYILAAPVKVPGYEEAVVVAGADMRGAI